MTPDFSTDAAKWAACLRRDKAADGRFLVAVRTTKIYCRPVCTARPKRENVRFVATAAEAKAFGCRACLRCRPPE